MSKHTTNQKNASATRQTRFHLPLLLTIAAFILVLFSAFIALTFHLQTSQAQRAISTPSVNQQQVQTPVATAAPKYFVRKGCLLMLNSTLVSIYAGSMTHNPQVGVLCVLREDITTGQLHVTMYQASQMRGALTILAINKSILTVTDSTKAIGTFDLSTNQFHW